MVSILCASCHSYNDSLNELQTLSEQLSDDISYYTDEDWDDVSCQLVAIEEEIQQNIDKYTDEELKEIRRLEGKCAGLITKRTMKIYKEQTEDMLKQSKALNEGFEEGFGDYDEVDIDFDVEY